MIKCRTWGCHFSLLICETFAVCVSAFPFGSFRFVFDAGGVAPVAGPLRFSDCFPTTDVIFTVIACPL